MENEIQNHNENVENSTQKPYNGHNVIGILSALNDRLNIVEDSILAIDLLKKDNTFFLENIDKINLEFEHLNSIVTDILERTQIIEDQIQRDQIEDSMIISDSIINKE